MHTSSFHPALTSLTGPESDSGTEWPFSNLCVCPYSDVVQDIFLKIFKKNLESGIICDVVSCSQLSSKCLHWFIHNLILSNDTITIDGRYFTPSHLDGSGTLNSCIDISRWFKWNCREKKIIDFAICTNILPHHLLMF